MPNQNLVLHIVRLKCGDETGGKWVEKAGTDQMYLSVIGVDAAMRVSKVDPFRIGGNFNDGSLYEFSPPKPLLTLSVPASGSFPKTCSAHFILCENYDGKGHQEATKVAFEKAQSEARSAKADGGANVAGAALSGVLIDAIKQRLANHFKDKLFPLQTVTLDVPNSDYRWGDGTKWSPEITLRVMGHEGVYYLVYAWEIRNA